METEKSYKAPNPVWFVIRLFILAALVLLFFSYLVFEADNRDLFRELRNAKEDTDYYDYYYYRGAYGSLRDLMSLYDLPDNKVYGKYYEIILAKEHKNAYDDYKRAAEAGMDCESYAEKELQALKEMAASPAFPENAERIKEMLE